jgi:hypothetical protein
MKVEAMLDKMPVVRTPADFDARSGNWLERLVFNHRGWVVLMCAAMSLWLGFEATRLQVNASFEKMIPQSHPYIRNYLDNRKDLAGISNAVRVVVEHVGGDIYDRPTSTRSRRSTTRSSCCPAPSGRG